MTEYVDEKDQKWNELKLKWSSSSSPKSTIQEKQKLPLNKKQTQSNSLSNLIDLQQAQLEMKLK